ncbi:TrkH family potassium uptake protein [Kovacikia minuta CCNUW1]|uniref:TrkH family potassium uptake protein n=1 Tax=Kovacikia minuta TaxID=2931930 RepID=UPI001CCF6D73|nr:TrkH family potassium uptake protein [Kovacikia minuta]UBF27641.1 TrkH family potassium uptake protein [Kovacikia minuta CCNUW1]
MTVSRTICLGFLAVIAAGTLLLTFPISVSDGLWGWDHVIVALFTATSAVCVTGHIVVDTGTYFSTFGQLVILALIQVGGLGYMTATTFLLLLVGRRFSLRDKVAMQEALDRTGMQGLAQVIRSIIATTLIFEITGAFLLLFVFSPKYGLDRGLWLAIFHSVSAWNNAGFSLFADSLMSYQSSLLLNLVIPGLIIFGGIGYEVIFEMYLWLRDRLQRRPQQAILSLNFKVAVSTTLLLLLLGTVAFFLVELRNPQTLGSVDLSTELMAAWFQSVTPRTAGFNTIDIGKMTTAGLFITIALMFIGGSPGGTAGGIKTTTLRVLTSCTKAILYEREEVNLYARQIPLSLILKAVAVAVGSFATVVGMTILISLSDPEVNFIQILFEVVSAFATVGLSTGITAGLSTFAKLILVATMYIGRVGVLLFMAAILGDPKPSFVRFPEENLLVG